MAGIPPSLDQSPSTCEIRLVDAGLLPLSNFSTENPLFPQNKIVSAPLHSFWRGVCFKSPEEKSSSKKRVSKGILSTGNGHSHRESGN